MLVRDTWLSAVRGVDCWNVDAESVGSVEWRLWKAEESSSFVTAKIPTSRVDQVRRLALEGFYVVDAALTLAHVRDGARALSAPTTRDGTMLWEASSVVPREAAEVGLLAARAMRWSRFHLDPGIPDTEATAIKREWAENLATGKRGVGCRVVRGATGVLGFLGVVSPTSGIPTLAIDLIGVAPESQGQGVGHALIRDFLAQCASRGARAVVGTQSANISAVRFYERCGFALADTHFVMHRHSPGETRRENRPD